MAVGASRNSHLAMLAEEGSLGAGTVLRFRQHPSRSLNRFMPATKPLPSQNTPHATPRIRCLTLATSRPRCLTKPLKKSTCSATA